MATLAQVNAFRVAQGLTPFDVMPGTMRPGKTQKKNRSQINANKVARAEANRAIKANRQRKGK